MPKGGQVSLKFGTNPGAGNIAQVREPYVSLYSYSKLAQIAGSEMLSVRFGPAVSFACVNPGGVASDIWRGTPAWQQWVLQAVLASPEAAAATVVEVCVCPLPAAPSWGSSYWNGYRGACRIPAFEYWGPLAAWDSPVLSTPSRDALDAVFSQRLWDQSMGLFERAGFKLALESSAKRTDCASTGR